MELIKIARHRSTLAIALALGLLTFVLYAPTLLNNFVDYDDQGYLTTNDAVTHGLSWSGVGWAFSSFEQGNWHPLTWLSHMVDCQLFGLHPAGHHLVNVLFHTANTLLVFVFLKRMTGREWPSAFVAALFGWHPLHVESVAWASERKDVLCAFFWLLTLLVYSRYTKRPHAGTYLLALLLFACALMSKPMAVTLPCVLLLLDFWPLNRWEQMDEGILPGANSAPVSSSSSRGHWWCCGIRLILEKAPFFLLSAADSWVTFLAQKHAGAVLTSASLPFSYRLENAAWSYLRYLSNTFLPLDLSVIYPYKAHLPVYLVSLSLVLLLVWSALFLFWRARFPYLLTGWFWFLGTLVPAIGLIQVGAQSMADRYMYLPSIGLFILIVWGLNDLTRLYPAWQMGVRVVGIAALSACLVATTFQITYWQNTLRLFTHAVNATGDNGVAYYCLGLDLEKSGDHSEALTLYQKATEAAPDYYPAQFGFGSMLLEKGDYPSASNHFLAAEKLDPRDPKLEFDMGMLLLKARQNLEGIKHLQVAASLAKKDPTYHACLGYGLQTVTNLNGAIEEYSQALALRPDYAYARYGLAATLIAVGQTNEGLAQYQLQTRLHPQDPESFYNLGLALLDNRQFSLAQTQFETELKLAPDEIRAHYRLAQALAGEGRFAEAASEYQIVTRRLPDFGDAKAELAHLLAAHPELK